MVSQRLMQQVTQRLTIATRQSRLALWQAEFVKAELLRLYPHLQITLLPMSTRGDQILDRSLAAIGGKGLFIKELENAMASGQADLAVHSCKDVPMALPDGFMLAAICEREDPRDAFLSVQYGSAGALAAGAVVGTSSLRREAQLRDRFPEINVQPLRGNLDTRIGKLDRGEYAAIVLALAGVKRLGLQDRVREVLALELCLPAVGQGALAIETPVGRDDLQSLLAGLHHAPSAACVMAERAVSRALGGSCQLPLAAYAMVRGTELYLRGLVASRDGRTIVRAEAAGAIAAPEALGAKLAESLRRDGAEQLLARAQGQ